MSTKERYDRRLNKLKNERETWVNHWKDINDYIVPRRGRFLTSERNKGDKKNDKIIDSAAGQALNILVSGLMSGVTSPARKWFRLVTPDPDLREFGPVKEWLNLVETVMYDVFTASNLYTVLPYVYEEMALYGTAAIHQLNDFDTVTRFEVYPTGEYSIAQNHHYQVNTIYREVMQTVEQLVGNYGYDVCSGHVQRAYDKGDMDLWIETVHLIEPNPDANPDSPFTKDMPFRSVCYEKGADGPEDFLEVSGYPEFPVYAPRWHTQPPDVYGRSPGMDCLGDVKQLQDQQKKKSQAIAKKVNPPMVGPSSLKNQRMSTLPGDVTFVDTAQGAVGFQPAYVVDARLNEMLVDIQDVRERIRSAFYADLFLLMTSSDRRQITATEIDSRESEKLLVLGPLMGRLDRHLLSPLCEATFKRITSLGLVPPAPQELQGSELKTEFLSVMAMAQKAQGVLGIQEAAGFVGNMAQINPEVIDKMDFDQAVDEFATMRGLPPGVIRNDDDVLELRNQRQQQMQMQQMAAMGQQAAEGAKTLSDTQTNERNMLTDILGGNMGTPPPTADEMAI